MTGPFDFLHIKGRTAGSSNELSFDVLDAARSGLDAKKNKSNRPIAGPKPSQGTYHGVGGTSTLSAVPEVERRKRVRRARTVRLRVLVVVACVALVSVGAYFGYRFYQDTMDYSTRFSSLIERFMEADKTMVQIDALMKDPLVGTQAVERADVRRNFDQVGELLDGIAVDAQDMAAGGVADADLVALGQVQDAVQARKEMMAAADDAFTLASQVNTQASMAEKAWANVLQADGIARDAAAAANEANTEEATTQARDLTAQALQMFTEARTSLANVQEQVPSSNLAPELNYLDKRVEALEAALQTADALLAADRETATAANDAYNQADREAAELAQALSDSIGDQVREGYSANIAVFQERYNDARSRVAVADASLRSYLPN